MMVYKVIGLMSGTSLDGLDLAYCNIWEKENAWNFELKQTKSISYEPQMKTRLKNAIHLGAEELLILNNEYGTWLGQKASDFIDQYDLKVDFISSHGHTTHHQPVKGLTYQIGSGQHIAISSKCKVVCDFRTYDVALNGQGAPLVPIGDQLFFNQYDFCLNLGGISNISFDSNGKRIAFDIGLANMILNYITNKIDLSFDDNGQLARKGSINQQMFAELNALEYYKQAYPKSTGYEWFLEKVVPIIEKTEDSIENLLHTSVHHVCEQIANQVKQHHGKDKNSIFVTGGGALNGFLMETLQNKLSGLANIIESEKELIEYKEALVFALMGVLRVEYKTNVLSSVTGAKFDSSSGVIFSPN